MATENPLTSEDFPSTAVIDETRAEEEYLGCEDKLGVMEYLSKNFDSQMSLTASQTTRVEHRLQTGPKDFPCNGRRLPSELALPEYFDITRFRKIPFIS